MQASPNRGVYWIDRFLEKASLRKTSHFHLFNFPGLSQWFLYSSKRFTMVSLNLFWRILDWRHVSANRFLDIRMYSKSMFAIAPFRVGLRIQCSRGYSRQTAIRCGNKSTFYFHMPTTIKTNPNANVVHQPHPQITATLPMNTTARRAKCYFSSISDPPLFLLVRAPFTSAYKNRLITFSTTFYPHSTRHDQHSGGKSIFNCTLYFLMVRTVFRPFSRHHRSLLWALFHIEWLRDKTENWTQQTMRFRIEWSHWKLNSACFDFFLNFLTIQSFRSMDKPQTEKRI